MMNLDFENNNYRFNARTSAIIYDKTKTMVLLYKVNDGRDFYMLPGGRIKLGEDSKIAIDREIKEELDFELNYSLCALQENFIYKNGKNIMQYCFCYKAVYSGSISNELINCKDNENQFFKWINIKEINSYKIYPTSTKELILKDKDTYIKHIIEKNN